uniref:BTB domain-containing protein n=1 Tax=Panagrolaimus superbus TaxID=310955 RepID=A0A914YEZ9_9BILA
MENEKKIEAVYNFSVDSVNFNCGLQYTFETSGGQGYSLCLTDDLFDPLKGYFIDGYLTINFNGILLTETNEKIELNAKKRYKDFTIVVGDKDIKVQKEVLIKASPVMAAMFESGLKESDENKMP